jgi:hypothetical protein
VAVTDICAASPFRIDYWLLSCSAQRLKLGEIGLWNTPWRRAI